MPFSAQRVWFWFQVDSGVRLGEFMFGDLILLRIQKHKLIKHKVRFSLYFLFLWVKLCSNQILCVKSSKHHSGHRSINRSVHKTSENSSAQFHRAACDVSKSPNHENTSLHVSMFKKFSIQHVNSHSPLISWSIYGLIRAALLVRLGVFAGKYGSEGDSSF